MWKNLTFFCFQLGLITFCPDFVHKILQISSIKFCKFRSKLCVFIQTAKFRDFVCFSCITSCELRNLTYLDVQTLCCLALSFKTYLEVALQLSHWNTPVERQCRTISVFDTLCKCSLNFVQKGSNSENVLLNFVSHCALCYSIVYLRALVWYMFTLLWDN